MPAQAKCGHSVCPSHSRPSCRIAFVVVMAQEGLIAFRPSQARAEDYICTNHVVSVGPLGELFSFMEMTTGQLQFSK